MKYALVAGDKFDASSNSQYIQTIVSKCISKYIELSQLAYDTPSSKYDSLPDEAKIIDSKLVLVAERMIESCVQTGKQKLALGVALEARRLDIIEKIVKSQSSGALISYTLDCAATGVNHREFRNKVLYKLVDIIRAEGVVDVDFFLLAKVIVRLNDSGLAFDLFKQLLSSSEANSKLTAFQVAFDLVASASQELLQTVSSELEAYYESISTESSDDRYTQVLKILSGVPTCDMNITFLQKHNNTDLTILNKTKTFLEGRSSMFHSAVTFQNAFLHAGTTADGFFRNNLEWLAKATNWTKFSATAALGVMHQGNLSQGRRILQPYLPGSQGSAYTEGGSLYALGLVFAGHGREILDYLRSQIVEGGSNNNEQGDDSAVLLHGAALGVGVAGMGCGHVPVYEELRNILFSDSAVAGEGAGLAMGLVMVGSRNEEIQEEMLQYARDTQHEKIIRSLAVGIALLNYGKEEAADAVIETLIADQDAILRYGGAFTIALAYAGTGNNKAIKLLLHMAVSDANDDVRRAAVMGLGFIMVRNYTAVPRMVELLSESHNPHVRYGTAMALGISCAGTGLKKAINVLQPMLKDPVDFVRQGSMIALAMICIEQNEKTVPQIKSIQQAFAKVIASKHEDAMAKFGAALAQGIIDAGGRNVTISLEHGSGRGNNNLDMKSVVGMAVFVQFWYWFPLAHFLSLAFTPTAIIGVREDLKIAKFEFDCHAKSQLFEYPPKVEEASEKTPEKMMTAILSTTMRAKHREKKVAEAKKKRQEEEEEEDEKQAVDEKMDVDGEPSTDAKVKTEGDEADEDIIVDDEDEEEVEEDIRARKSYKIENMSRVLPKQLKYISFPTEGRFVPVRPYRGTGGVLVMIDKQPDEPVEVIKTVRQINDPEEEEEEEAPLPEPFTYE